MIDSGSRLNQVDIEALHSLARDLLIDCTETPSQHEKQALALLAEAGQALYAACINLKISRR